MNHEEDISTNFEIINAHGLTIRGLVQQGKNPAQLAIVCHGLGGTSEEGHIRALRKEILNAGYTVVVYDATNSIGKSDGALENVTFTNYFSDLESVYQWVVTNLKFTAPILLAGHSLGAGTALHFSALHPEKVKGVIAASSVISGELFVRDCERFFPKEFLGWKAQGYADKVSSDGKTLQGRISWNFVADLQKLDLLKEASLIRCPVVFIAGELDQRTSVDSQKALYTLLREKATLKVIAEAPHTFREEKHLKSFSEVITKWLIEALALK